LNESKSSLKSYQSLEKAGKDVQKTQRAKEKSDLAESLYLTCHSKLEGDLDQYLTETWETMEVLLEKFMEDQRQLFSEVSDLFGGGDGGNSHSRPNRQSRPPPTRTVRNDEPSENYSNESNNTNSRNERTDRNEPATTSTRQWLSV